MVVSLVNCNLALEKLCQINDGITQEERNKLSHQIIFVETFLELVRKEMQTPRRDTFVTNPKEKT